MTLLSSSPWFVPLRLPLSNHEYVDTPHMNIGGLLIWPRDEVHHRCLRFPRMCLPPTRLLRLSPRTPTADASSSPSSKPPSPFPAPPSPSPPLSLAHTRTLSSASSHRALCRPRPQQHHPSLHAVPALPVSSLIMANYDTPQRTVFTSHNQNLSVLLAS